MSYVYRIEHSITGQFYIGSRYSYKDIKSDLWVVYFTSSRYVKDLILKYGKDSFRTEIIQEFDDKNSCFVKEQNLISEYIDNSLCLNKHYFKNGKKVFLNFRHSEETRLKISLGLTGKDKSKFSVDEKRLWSLSGRIKALDDKSRLKRKDTYSKIKHQSGNKNSQYGTIWITDGINNKKHKKELPIPVGWSSGRIIKLDN